MIKLNIRSPFKGASVFYKPETESTMIDARNLASQGFPSGTVVTAGHQYAGRGRFPDRRWESAHGESLILTILFHLRDLPDPPGPAPLQAGLALASALERDLDLEPKIKWPNDVYLMGRKAAGILSETRGEELYIGMGVNCGPKSYPREMREKAVCLREAAGRKIRPEELLPTLLQELHTYLFHDGDWKSGIEQRLFLKDEEIVFIPGLPGDEEKIVRGRLAGILKDGSILIKTDASPEPLVFASGEIRFDPPRRSLFGRIRF